MYHAGRAWKNPRWALGAELRPMTEEEYANLPLSLFAEHCHMPRRLSLNMPGGNWTDQDRLRWNRYRQRYLAGYKGAVRILFDRDDSRDLAVAMGEHNRLGAGSLFRLLDANVIGIISRLTNIPDADDLREQEEREAEEDDGEEEEDDGEEEENDEEEEDSVSDDSNSDDSNWDDSDWDDEEEYDPDSDDEEEDDEEENDENED